MKRCIVNVWSSINSRENYKKGSERMVQSAIENKFIGDFLIFSPEYEYSGAILSYNNNCNCNKYMFKNWGYSNKYGTALSHKEAPHQFKSYVIQFARESGYDQIMWCDSSTIFLKNPDKYFDLAKEIGVVTFDADNANEAEWTSDLSLELMECSIDYAKNISQISSGVMIFDFRREITNIIFDDFIKYCSNPDICNGNGSKRPEFKEHRHDQSIMSYVIRKHGAYPLTYGGYMWGGDLEKVKKYSPTFLNYGIEKNLKELENLC